MLFNSFGGSGYDIACAQIDLPIIYQLNQGSPQFEAVNFDPSFKDKLYFVHLNKKQVSSEGIKAYKRKKVNQDAIQDISNLSNRLLTVTSLDTFNEIIKKHESIVGELLGVEPVQQRLFPDFPGQIKSLGAWGGDFILVSGDTSTKAYFNKKGFQTVIPYVSMIKHHE